MTLKLSSLFPFVFVQDVLVSALFTATGEEKISPRSFLVAKQTPFFWLITNKVPCVEAAITTSSCEQQYDNVNAFCFQMFSLYLHLIF